MKVGESRECHLDVAFSEAVTFKLIEGKGPVYINGVHLSCNDDQAYANMEDDMDDDVEVKIIKY